MPACKHPERYLRMKSRGEPLHYRYQCTKCMMTPESWSTTPEKAKQEWEKLKQPKAAPSKAR